MKFKPVIRKYSWTLPPTWSTQKLALDCAIANDPSIPEGLAAAIRGAKTPRGIIRAVRVYAGGRKDVQEKIESVLAVQSGRESSITVAHPNLT